MKAKLLKILRRDAEKRIRVRITYESPFTKFGIYNKEEFISEERRFGLFTDIPPNVLCNLRLSQVYYILEQLKKLK